MAVRSYPDFEQLSFLTAALALTLLLAELITIPGGEINFDLFGILVNFELNINTVTAVLAAGLSASGTAWLVHHHPAAGQRNIAQTWILPALSAWALSIILRSIPFDGIWWLMLGLGCGLLVSIWTAEFVLIDPRDANFKIALSGMSNISFILFFALAIALRAADIRLIFLLPTIAVPAALTTGRILFLRLQASDMLLPENVRTVYFAGLAIFLTALHFVTVFHFLPLTPISFGLAVGGPIFAANRFFNNMAEERPRLRAFLEPALLLAFFWVLAIWMNS